MTRFFGNSTKIQILFYFSAAVSRKLPDATTVSIEQRIGNFLINAPNQKRKAVGDESTASVLRPRLPFLMPKSKMLESKLEQFSSFLLSFFLFQFLSKMEQFQNWNIFHISLKCELYIIGRREGYFTYHNFFICDLSCMMFN